MIDELQKSYEDARRDFVGDDGAFVRFLLWRICMALEASAETEVDEANTLEEGDEWKAEPDEDE